MFFLRSFVRKLSLFSGSPEAFLALKDPSSISSLSIFGPAPKLPPPYQNHTGRYSSYTPSDQGMADVMNFINSTQHVKKLYLCCTLTSASLEIVSQGLAKNKSLESLSIHASAFGSASLLQLFKGLRANNSLNEFEAFGEYVSYGATSLNEPLVHALADIVQHNPKLMKIGLSGISIKEEHRPIILKPYDEISDRPLAEIQIAYFWNGDNYPEHSKVNEKDFDERELLLNKDVKKVKEKPRFQ